MLEGNSTLTRESGWDVLFTGDCSWALRAFKVSFGNLVLDNPTVDSSGTTTVNPEPLNL